MVYTDEDGFTGSDYDEAWKKAIPIAPFEGTDWQHYWANLKAKGLAARHYEFVLTWATLRPESGNYIEVLDYSAVDKLAEGLSFLQRMLKLFNKAVVLPSGGTLFSGEGSLIDYVVPETSHQDPVQQMNYIVGFKYRIHYDDDGNKVDWTVGTLRRRTKIFMIPLNRQDVSKIIDGERVWNYDSISTSPNDKLRCRLMGRSLGPHIFNAFKHESGISATSKWRFKTDEEEPRYLLGTHEYWTTHGFPDGRKYRIWNDFVLHDGAFITLVAFLVKRVKRLGLGARFATAFTKLITSGFNLFDNENDIDTVLDGLDAKAGEYDSFNSFNEMFNKNGELQVIMDYIKSFFANAYSPQKGVLRL